MNAEAVWRELEKGIGMQPGVLSRRVDPDSDLELFLAVTAPEGKRMLVLAVESGELEAVDELPTGRAIEMRLNESVPGDHVNVELVLNDVSASDVFAALVTDVVSAIAEAGDESEAVALWTGRVRRWQRLLEALRPDGLSPQRQRGLYAELWMLREHLAPHIGPAGAVHGWTGPDAASHDFQFPTAALEVKATASKRHQVLRIASERQLDDTGTPALYLGHLSLDVRRGEGETLPEMVETVRGLMPDSVVASVFEERLLASGYMAAHVPIYTKTAYTRRDSAFFVVEGEFPRIVENGLRLGVGDVSYSVSVAECHHWKVDDGEFLTALRDS